MFLLDALKMEVHGATGEKFKLIYSGTLAFTSKHFRILAIHSQPNAPHLQAFTMVSALELTVECPSTKRA